MVSVSRAAESDDDKQIVNFSMCQKTNGDKYSSGFRRSDQHIRLSAADFVYLFVRDRWLLTDTHTHTHNGLTIVIRQTVSVD